MSGIIFYIPQSKTLINMKRTFLSTTGYVIMSCLALISLLSSCSKTSDNNQNNQQVSGLMAFNLSPDKQAGLVVALSNNSITQSPLTYTNYTGGYINIYPGSRTVQAYDYNNTNTAITNSTFNFDNNKYYSLFVVGADTSFRNIIAEDRFDSLSSTNGKAYVRYINAIPDSINPKVTIAANGTNVVSENAHYTTVSQFVAITPGQVTVTIDNGSSISATRTITLEQQKVYTILLVGKTGTIDPTKTVQIKFIANGSLTQ